MVALDKTVSGTWREPKGFSMDLPVLEIGSLAQVGVALQQYRNAQTIATSSKYMSALDLQVTDAIGGVSSVEHGS